MVIKSLYDLLSKNGINAGDSICIFSDVSKFPIPESIKQEVKDLGVEKLLKSYVDTFKELVGKDGLIIMPTFTYSPMRSEIYNPDYSKSRVGVLTEYFRKSDSVERSSHPIFSFACWGSESIKFLKLENFHCFGDRSLFGKMYNMRTKYILFGVNIQLGATFIYYSLEKNNVYYRYNKSFTSKIKIGNKSFEKQVKYFVRDLSLKYKDDWHGLEKLSIKRGICKSIKYNKGRILITSSNEIDTLIQSQLNVDKDYLIKKYWNEKF